MRHPGFIACRTWLLAAAMATVVAARHLWAQQAKTHLPSVLIIGDSTTMGYSVHLAPMLKGEIQMSARNAFTVSDGISNLVSRLGDGKWDVIVFNHGLHDMKLVPDGEGQTRRQVPAAARPVQRHS